MTNNQKIILGVGAIALAYWLYKRKGSGKSRQTPSTPKKENDANFSNFGSGVGCERRFCPPKRPYVRYRSNGTCYCSDIPRTTQTVSQQLSTLGL